MCLSTSRACSRLAIDMEASNPVACWGDQQNVALLFYVDLAWARGILCWLKTSMYSLRRELADMRCSLPFQSLRQHANALALRSQTLISLHWTNLLSDLKLKLAGGSNQILQNPLPATVTRASYIASNTVLSKFDHCTFDSDEMSKKLWQAPHVLIGDLSDLSHVFSSQTFCTHPSGIIGNSWEPVLRQTNCQYRYVLLPAKRPQV